MLNGAIWIVCLFVEVLEELGTESFMHDGYVVTLSVLLFVSYSGLQACPCFCYEVRTLLSVFFVDVRCDACGDFVFRL